MKGDINAVIGSLTAHDGAEMNALSAKPAKSAAGAMPGMQHTKERVLSFISKEDAAPFLQQNGMEIVKSYVTQATRRAEWARRFGGDNARLEALKKQAVEQHGATPEQIRQVDRYLSGADGTPCFRANHIANHARSGLSSNGAYRNLSQVLRCSSLAWLSHSPCSVKSHR